MNKVYPLDVTTGYPRGGAPMPPPPVATEAENVISVQRVVRAVRRRLSLMIAVFVLTFAAVALYSFQLKPAYTATSRVIVNSRSEKVVDIGAVLSGMPANTAMIDTEAEVLRSRSLIGKVVQRLDLTKNPEFNPSLRKPSDFSQRIDGVKSFLKGLMPFGKPDAAPPPPPAPGSPEAIEAEKSLNDKVIDSVRGAIAVARVGSTYIIEIKANSGEPKMAAPNELPMVRKNVTPEVATPRSSNFAVFCTVRISTCMHRPMPVPRTNRYSDWRHTGVSAPICDSNTNAPAITAVPTTGKIL